MWRFRESEVMGGGGGFLGGNCDIYIDVNPPYRKINLTSLAIVTILSLLSVNRGMKVRLASDVMSRFPETEEVFVMGFGETLFQFGIVVRRGGKPRLVWGNKVFFILVRCNFYLHYFFIRIMILSGWESFGPFWRESLESLFFFKSPK